MPNEEKAGSETNQTAQQEREPAPAPNLSPNQSNADETETEKIREQPQKEKQVAAKRIRKRRRYIKLTEKRLAVWLPVIISALVFFVTCASIFYAYRQWQTMETQGKIMQESLRISERAYVAVYSIETDLNLGTATILLENKGRLPAKNIRVNTVQYVWLGDNQEPTVENRQEFYWGEWELYPGNYKIPVLLFLDGRVRSPENTCIVAGVLFYSDGFGFTIKTGFAFSYSKVLNQWAPVNTGVEGSGPPMRQQK